MKVQCIVEAEVSISEAVNYIIRSSGGHYRLGEVVLPRYAVGDAVRIEGYDAQDNLGVVCEVLPYDSEEHGDSRAYTVRFLLTNGIMVSRDIYEKRIGRVVLASRKGAMSTTCRGNEDMPDPIRPLTYLTTLLKSCRRQDIYDLLCGSEDPLAGVKAFVEAENLILRLATLTRTTIPQLMGSFR